ncbi:hypothetical protein HY570_00120 [Candidatus Micrarchaeota archaeon]|nr:hypothetical protein [Candidatus Micrarchaeota archaeon]
MEDINLLKRVAQDINFLKKKVNRIEEEVLDISNELHEVRPEYIKKLKKIKDEGTISQKEFEKKFGVRF